LSIKTSGQEGCLGLVFRQPVNSWGQVICLKSNCYTREGGNLFF